MPVALSWTKACGLGDKIYIMGGASKEGPFIGSIEVYDLAVGLQPNLDRLV